ncbi:PREDICTED: spindle pole body component 110-like [Nicotiana attenuata]|uniref:spindle pole body component 110-like n=1 Tax=Nicotiana attenuata TaxID=49451 RepID=UPI00090499F9|nr:PREDICTED: spindle pole body component 110-like [Nicotiana attenuata]
MIRRNGGIPKRGSSSRPKNYDLCHKCAKPGHFIKDCPLLKQEHFKYNPDKAAKRNPVPDKRFKRKNAADNAVSLVDDKDALTIELGDAEQTRDDLVVCVVDLKETISDLENEKVALNAKIVSVEHERDDFILVVVDLKETIENLSKEKNDLVEKIDALEQERDDLLVVIIDLRETIEELKAERGSGRTDKGKGVVSEAHIRLENKLNAVKISLCDELEKTRQLQAELDIANIDLEKSLKWTWSSDAITAVYVHNGGNRSKDETFELFVAFVKKIQVKMDLKVA